MRAASALLALAAVAAWACLCSGGVPAVEDRPQIRLQTGTLDVLSQPHRPPAGKRWHGRRRLGQAAPVDVRWGPLAGARQLLIAHSRDGEAEVLEQLGATLRAHGGWLGGYLPDSAVLGIGSDAAAEACRQLPGVLWVGSLAAEHKLAPELRAGLAGGLLPTAAADIAVSFPLLHYADAAEEAAGGLGPAYDPAAAAAAEWPAALAAAGVPARVRRRDSHTVTATVPAERAQAAVAWLSGHPAVHWLAPAASARLHNWQGTAVTQSATAAPAAPVPLDQDQGTHPLWAAGLTGAGQVIGGGDSGMDYNNCFFADPAVNWTQGLQTDAATGTVSFNSTTHRKIRLYRSLAAGIEAGGHGTHTMGSLLGSVLNASDLLHSDYRGMAPDARLAFNDLGSADGISTPENLAADYFSFAYAVGARVHSDSWGSAATAYDHMAAQVDLFTWQHQDFTSVFAAGNEGAVSASTSAGATTVTSPATAKNCVTVGATEVAGQTPAANPQFVTAQMTVRQVGGPGNDTSILASLVMQAAFGGSLASLFGQQLALSVAQPLDGCGRLQNAADVNGTLALVQRGTCYVSTKVANAQTAGARAVVVYDNQISEYFLMLADGGAAPGIGIPSMAAPRLVGQLLAGQLQAGGRLQASFEAAPPQQAWANLAPFSSKGPTPDGRIKPDVLAPGTLLSAHTDASSGDTCALQRMQGTSMATPLVAGSAALVRQYFLSGAYPSGAPDAAAAFAPSGPLVKAVLIGGAAALGGFEPDTGLPLAPPPSFRQGFGRVLLSRSLPLQGAGKGWGMQLVDAANLTTGGSHRYCLSATGGPLSVTLVWHDYPALLSAAKKLVNDLDLTVRAAGLNGVPMLGNGGEQGSDGPDRTNNVEQVALAYMPPGQLSIEVAAHQVFVPQGPQPYSLVVLGSFAGSLASPANPAGPGVSAGDCSLLVPQITGGPEGVTSNRSVSFSFGLRVGATGTPAFECAVAATDASAAPDFAPCTSPAAFSGLADGSHTFTVRVRGEQLGDSRAFVTDTTPPVLSFAGQLPADSASAAANLSWAAADASPVNASCRFGVQGGAPQQGALSLYQASSFPRAANASAGQWLPCTSPLAALGLLPGRWSFEVAAVDAAGNEASSLLSADWSVAFQPGLPYARWEEAPLGLTDSAEPGFSLQVLAATGAGLADADAAGLVCQLVGGDAAASAAANVSDAGSAAAADGWQACGESPSFGSLADGTWAVLARPTAGAAGEQLAATVFTVDTTPPSVQITEAANAVSNSSSVQLSFQSDDPAAQFSCSLAAAGAAAGFQPCTSPARYANLTDGSYSFRVLARDAAGNEAPPAAAAFRVDTRPPAFADIRYPVAVRPGGGVRVAFVVQDAPDGSGVNSTECRLQAVKLAGDAGNFTSGGWQNCSSPFTFGRLPQGRYVLSLKATDNAALVSTTSDMDVWVSSAPPTPVLLGGPGQASPVPSSVAFNFTFAAANGLGTPVTAVRCRLVQLTRETAAAAAAAPPSNASLPGAVQSPVQGGDAKAMSARFWQTAALPAGELQNASLPLAPAAAGNLSVPAAAPAAASDAGTGPGSLAPVAASVQAFAGSTDAGWRDCSSPVAYQGLRSGNYSFQVAGADAAGNQGPLLPSYRFAVDAGLAPDGGRAAAFWGLGWKFWLIIAGSGALLVFAATGAALAACFGRRRRRQGGPGAYVQEQLEGAQAGPADGAGFSAEATAEALRRSLAGLKQQQQQQQQEAGGSEAQGWAQGLAQSRHEAQLLASFEDAQLREALQRSASLASGSGTATPLTARSTEAEQQRALLTSREDRDLHRALMLSLHEASLASARSEPAACSSRP